MTELIRRYLALFPQEQDRLALVRQFVLETPPGPQLYHRQNFRGHITASGFVLSPDRRQLAVVYHKVLNRHLQPGGHVEESDADILDAAHREVLEETGMNTSIYSAIDANALVPLDIDTHLIPANAKKGEPAHHHHDFRFLFYAAELTDPALFVRGGEAAWSWQPVETAIDEPSYRWVLPKLAGH